MPYSKKTIGTISLRQYSDALCMSTPTSISVSSGIQCFAQIMPASNVLLETNSTLNPGKKVLAYSEADNNLIVTFKPQTEMDPSGYGLIKI